MADEHVSVLREDPDLGKHLDDRRLRAAREELHARLVTVPAGVWDPTVHAEAVDDAFGLLVLDGVVVRRVGRQDRFGAELLGTGDLCRLSDATGRETLSSPFTTTWRAIAPVRLAVLDRDFVQRCAGYPEIGACLTIRAVCRARHLVVNLSIAHFARVDRRLELLLWHLADRFGRVTPQGVVLPMRLTHDLLADLVAAQRPSVTLSLQQLERAGRLRRQDGLLHLLGPPPSDDAEPA